MKEYNYEELHEEPTQPQEMQSNSILGNGYQNKPNMTKVVSMTKSFDGIPEPQKLTDEQIQYLNAMAEGKITKSGRIPDYDNLEGENKEYYHGLLCKDGQNWCKREWEEQKPMQNEAYQEADLNTNLCENAYIQAPHASQDLNNEENQYSTSAHKKEANNHLSEDVHVTSDIEQKCEATETEKQDQHVEKEESTEKSVREVDNGCVPQMKINCSPQENIYSSTSQAPPNMGQEAIQYGNNMYLAQQMAPANSMQTFVVNDNGANFSVRVIGRKRNIRNMDNATADQLLMKLCLDGIKEVDFSCGLDEVESIDKKITAIYPQALILKRKIFIASIRMQCSNLPTYFFVDEAGMYYSPQNGFEFYVGGKLYPMVINEVKEYFNFRGASDIKEAIQTCINLTIDGRKSVFILMYGLMATIKMFFESAGVPLRFAFMIYGESGSMKTSIAQVLFKMYDNQKLAGFTDTDAALERQLAMGKSRVLLVDDFHPGDSKEGQTRSLAKLEKLLRYVGDDKTRARSNLRGGIEKEQNVEGLLAITAEFVPTNCISSLARYFRLQLCKGEVNADELTQLQQNPGIVQLLYVKFVEYAVERQDEIMQIISQHGQMIRKDNRGKFKHARTLDQYVAFYCMIEIFLGFCNRNNVCVDARELFSTLTEYTKATEDVSEATRITLNAAKCIEQMIESGNMLARNLAEYVGTNKIGVMEFESDVVLFDEDRLLAQTKVELQKRKKEPMTDKQILEELQLIGVIEYRPNGKKKTRRIRKTLNNRTYPFIGIKRNILFTKIQEIEEKKAMYA